MNTLKKYALQEIPHYKVHGRTVPGVCPLPLFFNGSAVELNVSGTELWADLEVSWKNLEIWVTVEVNGKLMSRQMLMPGNQSLCLFRGMNPEPVKNVRITRETQAMIEDEDCCLIVHGFQADGSFYPVPAGKYTLEFVGDSITSGEGTYGAKKEFDWIPMFMSYSRDYAKMTAEALGADAYIISKGGWGVLSGWDNNPDCNIPSRYEQLCGLCCGSKNERLGAFAPYDFSVRKTDAVIVNLGTNDASAFQQPAWHDPATGRTFKQRLNPDGTYLEEDLNRFEDAVVSFLKMLRRHNPQAHIVWCYGMLSYDLSFAINEAMIRYTRESGDHNLVYLQLPSITEETVGSNNHPGKLSHERAARVLTEYLRDYFSK
ncbi:MAG: SGNH/GDSL hydrolase family protein [Lachnospiraceae bacterium]|nr:SGNH/GDSL hydrolase family protein [Lachnospiraceae bacterium]